MKWWEVVKQVSGVITAVTIILGLMGYVAKPHAEQFIQQSVEQMVQQKIDALDIKLRHVERSINENTRKGEAIQTEQKTITQQQLQIIRLLQQMRTPQ